MQSSDFINQKSFLQSSDWAEFQKKLSKQTFVERVGESELFLIENKAKLIGSYLYAPRAYFNNQKDVNIIIQKCSDLGLKTGAAFLRIEPQNLDALLFNGLVKTESIQPKYTLVSDILRDETDILKDVDPDTRYAIRTAEKRGVEITSSTQIGSEEAFTAFWKIFVDTNERQGISHYNKEYYSELASLNSDGQGRIKTEILLAKLDGAYIAGAVLLSHRETMTYLYAASMPGYGRFNAPSYLIWRAMLNAKKRGLRYFDFWGVSKPSAGNDNDKWSKLSAFKRSFGGTEIEYPDTFDLPINKPLYYIYRILKRIIK